jgi:hypothetical protein
MSAIEPQQIEIDGTRYELRPWDYLEFKRWLFKAAGLVTQLGAGADVRAFADLINSAGEETFLRFCGVVEKYTDIRGSKGELVCLEKVRDVFMRDHAADLLELIVAHVRMNFGPLFSERLPKLVGLLASTNTPAAP